MNRGGIETTIMNIYRSIDRSKLQFDFLVSLRGVYDEEINQLGGRVFYIPFINKTGPFGYTKDLRRFFNEHPEYSVIHVQMDRFGGFVAKQAMRGAVPYRLLHSNNTHSAGNILVRTVKNYYGRYIGCATHFLACGRDAAEWMFKKTDGIRYVRNGVNLSIFTNKDLRNSSLFTIGLVARFNKEKNHSFLIDVFNEVCKEEPASRMILAGTGPEVFRIRNRVNILGLSNRVEFLGQTDNVATVLQSLDVLCMPSLHEGLPVTLIEAQACGVPCVVSDVITEEVQIADAVFEYVSLKKDAKYWAERLLAYRNRPRVDNSKAIQSAGYDISLVAAGMQEFYISLNNQLK